LSVVYHLPMKIVCCVCQKPKPGLICGSCQSPVCKSCALTLGEYDFRYSPERLTKFFVQNQEDHVPPVFCGPCYDANVAPDLAKYESTLTTAKAISVFFKTQSKETRLIKRREDLVKVKDCPDYDDAILRLAFQAAVVDCNALIDVTLDSRKLKIGGYSKTVWTGTARPAKVTERALNNAQMVINNPN
jgi:hypothetical protein